MGGGAATGEFCWHFPWHCDKEVSQYGCSAVQYDCADTENIAILLAFYEKHGVVSGQPPQLGKERLKYTYNCIKHQCQGGADPGPPHTVLLRAGPPAQGPPAPGPPEAP